MKPIYYSQQNNGLKLNVVNCEFSGKLPNGARFIDGKKSSRLNAAMIFADSCRFTSYSNDIKDLINKDSVKLGANNRVFNTKESKIKINKVPFQLIVPVAAVILITLIAVVILKKNRRSPISDAEDEEENQQSSI